MKIPSFHWWRTVFFLIPAIGACTVVLGTVSLASSFFDRTGRFAHGCARWWSRLILATTGVRVRVEGLDLLEPGKTYIFVSNHQSFYDIPVLFWWLPHQLHIIAKESLGSFPFIGWHLRRTGHLLVDRRNRGALRLHRGVGSAGGRQAAAADPDPLPLPRQRRRPGAGPLRYTGHTGIFRRDAHVSRPIPVLCLLARETAMSRRRA